MGEGGRGGSSDAPRVFCHHGMCILSNVEGVCLGHSNILKVLLFLNMDITPFPGGLSKLSVLRREVKRRRWCSSDALVTEDNSHVRLVVRTPLV